MAPSLVSHTDCHIFSFVISPEDQIVGNALTRETATVKRTEQMISSHKVYDLKYGEDGWGYLVGSEDGKILLKSLGFKLLAKSDDRGRIFIHDSVAKRVAYIDHPSELSKGVEKHLTFSQKEQLTFIKYTRDRNVHAMPVGSYYQPSGTIFWEVRTFKSLINLEHLKGQDSVNVWVKQNFGRAKDFWDKMRKRVGLGDGSIHWLLSEMSRRAKLEADAKAQAKGVDKSDAATIFPVPIGTTGFDFSENFACSTQATLYSYLHWSKSLGSQGAKDSCLVAMDKFLEKCLGGVKRLWIASSDLPAGAITTRGVQVAVEGSAIRDASSLC